MQRICHALVGVYIINPVRLTLSIKRVFNEKRENTPFFMFEKNQNFLGVAFLQYSRIIAENSNI